MQDRLTAIACAARRADVALVVASQDRGSVGIPSTGPPPVSSSTGCRESEARPLQHRQGCVPGRRERLKGPRTRVATGVTATARIPLAL